MWRDCDIKQTRWRGRRGEWRSEKKEGKVTRAHDRASEIEQARNREQERERERERDTCRERAERAGEREREREREREWERGGGGGETARAYEREGAPFDVRKIKRKQTTPFFLSSPSVNQYMQHKVLLSRALSSAWCGELPACRLLHPRRPWARSCTANGPAPSPDWFRMPQSRCQETSKAWPPHARRPHRHRIR